MESALTHDHRFHLQSGSWSALAERVLPIRLKVFVEEQGVPQELEVDAHDALATHVIALDADGLAVGTGRLVVQNESKSEVYAEGRHIGHIGHIGCIGRIGRMAVLQAFRNQSVGSTLMRGLIELALARGIGHLRLNARTTAIGFYERFGFDVRGEAFDDAGSPHIEMIAHVSIEPVSPAAQVGAK